MRVAACVWIWLCLLIVGVAPGVHAQAGSAELTGVVRDQDAAVVPGASVTLTHATTNQARTLVTGSEGFYAATGLPPGEYQVRVEVAGFRSLVRNGVRLETGEAARLDLELVVGAVTEDVT